MYTTNLNELETKSLTVVIPAYNEAEPLTMVLPELLAYAQDRYWKVILVNDGSTDRTKEIMSNYSANDNLRVIHHKLNRGYGGALKSGIEAVDTEYIITIDADGQHYLEDIDILYKTIIEYDADMVVGSRKGLPSVSISRGIGKWLLRNVARLLMPIHIYDINSGMKIYRTILAKQYIRFCPDSMAFSEVITLAFINNRHLVLESPIRIKKRLAGESSIRMMTAFQTFMEIVNIIVLFNPMNIFLPISLVIIFLGLAWGIPMILKNEGASVGMSLLLIMGLFSFLLGLLADQLSKIRKNS